MVRVQMKIEDTLVTGLLTNFYFRNILPWVLLILLFVIFREHPTGFTNIQLACFITQQTILVMVPVYVTTLIILPIFRRGYVWKGILVSMLTMGLLFLSVPLILDSISDAFIYFFKIEYSNPWQRERLELNVISFMIFGIAINELIRQFLTYRERKELELELLRQQLNPHFLFNTLNNLYGLALQKSDKLPALMLKLSDLLRYSVDKTTEKYTFLEQELSYIRNYVDLEKTRLNASVNVNFEVTADHLNYRITPLLLINLVENCFTHFGISEDRKGFIGISISVHNGELILLTKNTTEGLSKSSKLNGKKSGINNLRHRLNLLYSGRHKLKTVQGKGTHEVELTLNLAK